MKLDLLYEIDVPEPWGKPHPYGPREAEQRAYAEALEQIQLADKLGPRRERGGVEVDVRVSAS